MPREDWTVDITEKGRSGTVNYREAAGSLSLSWEFGGGDVVAIIYFPDEASWNARHPWAAGRRTEILRRVADEAVRQKSPGSLAEIDERAGWINLRQTGPARAPIPANHKAFRDRKAKLTTMLALLLLLAAAAAIGVKVLTSAGFP